MNEVSHSQARSILSSKWSKMPQLPYGAVHRIILGEPTVGKSYAAKEGFVHDEDRVWNRWCWQKGLHGWDVIDSPNVRAKYREDVIAELATQLRTSDVAVWEEPLALELSLMTGAQIYPVAIATAKEYARRILDRYLHGEKPGMPADRRIERHLELEHDIRIAHWLKRFGYAVGLGPGEYLSDLYSQDKLRSPPMIWIHSFKGRTPHQAYQVHMFIGNADRDYYTAVVSYDRMPGGFDPSTRKSDVYFGRHFARDRLPSLTPCQVYGYKPRLPEVMRARREIIGYNPEESHDCQS